MANTSKFETQVVHAFQQFCDSTDIKAVAYRYRQLLWHGQFTDIAVDSPDKRFYLGIECKTIQFKKLYFRSNFHNGQIGNMNEFLLRSGRTGFLAIELRHRGTKSEAFIVPWDYVIEKIDNGDTGISRDDLVSYEYAYQFERVKEGYMLPPEFLEFNKVSELNQ
jgi:Holliday junction resolvase